MEIGRTLYNDVSCMVWSYIKHEDNTRQGLRPDHDGFTPPEVHIQMAVHDSVVASLYNPILLNIKKIYGVR